MSDQRDERLLRKEFDEIRARYTDLLRDVLQTNDVLPDWLLNPAQACGCGDKCSTGTTDMDRLNTVVFPEKQLSGSSK